MPSSTSNSNMCLQARAWVLAVLIALLLLSVLELAWRTRGEEKTVVDDQVLWSNERSKLGRTGREIALLGSSRMLTDVSPGILSELSQKYTVANLAVDGACPNVVLQDLAKDGRFRGIVLCDLSISCLLFGEAESDVVSRYIDFYRKQYNLNASINRFTATEIQRTFQIVDPNLSLAKVVGHYAIKKEMRPARYWTTYKDRSQAIDYSRLNLPSYRGKRLELARSHYGKLCKNGIPNELFERRVKEIEEWVEKIQNREGKVVFVNLPVSDEHWTLDEEYFPKKQYWDRFSKITKAYSIHFRDVETLRYFSCPDTSHLDFRDTPRFTSLLFDELLKRGVFVQSSLRLSATHYNSPATLFYRNLVEAQNTGERGDDYRTNSSRPKGDTP